jgi:pyroglutamyl-peptidase
MTDVLITGFGPFPGMPRNPSGAIATQLAKLRRPALQNLSRTAYLFPTSYAAVDRELPKLIAEHSPKILIMFGVAGRTTFMRVESIARNRQSVLHPDVTGATPTSLATTRKAPSQRRGRAPFVRLQHAARTAGMDARLSRDAGTYICNYVYWRALEATGMGHSPEVVVFIHVPNLRSRKRRKSRSRLPTLNRLVRASEAMLIAAKAHRPAR